MSQLKLIFKSFLMASSFILICGSANPVKNSCPNNQWVDATSVGMGCLRFELEKSMTWLEAQDSCKTPALKSNAYLVEILNEDQQLFIEAKAAEYESVTGIRRDWWIGLTDEGYENRWFWIHSLKVADYTSWQSTQPNGDFRSNFALIHHSLEGFKWFDYSNEQSPAFAICQLDMEY